MPEPVAGSPLWVALDWIEAHCVVPDGYRAGAPLELYDYQLRYLAGFYTVRASARWVPEAPVLGPAFVYRRGLLVEPQKKGKGPGLAAQCCLEGVGPALFAGWAGTDDGYVCAEHGCRCGWEYAYEPGEPMGMPWATPLIQLTAVSQEQTDNVYGALAPMIRLGPLHDLISHVGADMTRLPGGGRIDTVTSSAQSRLGARITFAPQDEVGLWTKHNKMARVADTQYRGLAGMGGRASLTTNAWDPSENSVAQQVYESTSTDVLRQFFQAPKNLSYTNARDRKRIHRLSYAETLTENGGHVSLDAIEAEAADLVSRDPGQAERFFGNRLTTGLGSWMPDGRWESSEDLERGVPAGTRIALGFDGSESDDWTAIRACTIDGYRFTPAYGPDRRPSIWNPAEWGGSIPRHEVHAAVDEIFRRYDVALMLADPPDWRSEIGDWAVKHGDKVVLEFATYRTIQMHAALERSLTDLISRRSTHDGCKLTALAVGNARKKAMPGQRYLLEKPEQHRKIDPAMADVLANEAAALVREKDENVEHHGWVF